MADASSATGPQGAGGGVILPGAGGAGGNSGVTGTGTGGLPPGSYAYLCGGDAAACVPSKAACIPSDAGASDGGLGGNAPSGSSGSGSGSGGSSSSSSGTGTGTGGSGTGGSATSTGTGGSSGTGGGSATGSGSGTTSSGVGGGSATGSGAGVGGGSATGSGAGVGGGSATGSGAGVGGGSATGSGAGVGGGSATGSGAGVGGGSATGSGAGGGSATGSGSGGSTASSSATGGGDAGVPATLACSLTPISGESVATYAPAGDHPVGGPCQTAADCSVGLACVATPSGGLCRPYCCGQVEECPLDTYCAPTAMAEAAVKIPVCLPVKKCKPLEDSTCDGGQTCTIVRDDGTTSCIDPGDGARGDACPCTFGYVCSKVNNTCLKLCHIGKDAADCGAGSCQGGVMAYPEGIGICVGYP